LNVDASDAAKPQVAELLICHVVVMDVQRLADALQDREMSLPHGTAAELQCPEGKPRRASAVNEHRLSLKAQPAAFGS
jgi:hypothetical protein